MDEKSTWILAWQTILKSFIVYQNLHQEAGLTQIIADHVTREAFGLE
jgi:hypothetical protein